MNQDLWARLAAPFPTTAMTWRVLRLAEDGTRAQVCPYLSLSAVLERLDAVAGVSGWANLYTGIGDRALISTLTIIGVSKSVVVSLGDDPVQSAEDALVRAAERFGMVPPADQKLDYWVDYDPESKEILYEPEFQKQPELPPEPVKVAGQLAIDRLIERLKHEGLGLEAAKLITHYNGYGSNPEQARELYGKLRALLRGEVPIGSR